MTRIAYLAEFITCITRVHIAKLLHHLPTLYQLFHIPSMTKCGEIFLHREQSEGIHFNRIIKELHSLSIYIKVDSLGSNQILASDILQSYPCSKNKIFVRIYN